MARMRFVYNGSDTQMIAHLWMNKNQSNARNSVYTFYFNGDTIYSYGNHFPIAKHVENSKGESAVLITTRTYSQTTSKHIGMVRDAVHGLVIEVYDPTTRFNNSKTAQLEQFSIYEENIKTGINKRMRARTEHMIDYWDRCVNREIETVRKFSEFFGLIVPMTLRNLIEINESDDSKSLLKKWSADAAERDRMRQELEDAERKARRQKQMQLLHATLANLDTSISIWRNTGEWVFNRTGEVEVFRAVPFEIAEHKLFPKGNLIRLGTDSNGKQRVMTSGGVVVGVRCAREAFDMLRSAWKAGDVATFVSLVGADVCGFRVRDINSERVIVGCHILYRKEIEEFAAVMGWVNEEAGV